MVEQTGISLHIGTPATLDNLTTSEDVIREPGYGEILVRIVASSLNYHDYAVVSGLRQTVPSLIPMTDGAGVVEAVGDGVQEFAVGDHVISCFFPEWEDGQPNRQRLGNIPGDQCDGFGAQYVTKPEKAFTHAPKNMNLISASTLPCAALTAWKAVIATARIKPGDWVLTQGTGGVSVFAVQFAKAAGARVVSLSSSSEKLDKLRQLGADLTINYRENPRWGRDVFKATGGVQEIVEVGGAGNLEQSLAASSIGGHISLIGVLAKNNKAVPIELIHQKQIIVTGIGVGHRSDQKAMIAAIEANHIEPCVDRTFPLLNMKEAFRYQESGAHFGKICLVH